VRGLTLDTGALIALERKDVRMNALLERMLAHPGAIIHIPAGVVAQAFRNGSRQVRLVRLLKQGQTRVVGFDEDMALAAGVLLGLRKASDVVDASVVLCARLHRQPVITADSHDLRRLDARIELHAV
jgi:PIN domain